MFLLRIALAGVVLIFSMVSASAQQPGGAAAPPLSAEAIMARVAANQDETESERAHYIYVQHAKVVSRKGKVVMCEEISDSRVTPSEKSYKVRLLKLNGRMFVKHKYVNYTTPHVPGPKDETEIKAEHDSLTIEIGGDTDRDLVEDMRSGLVNDDSKDGVSGGLFPLTSKMQADYEFRLLGRERLNGRDVFHLTFRPKDKSDYGWKGDAFIDTTAYQPVSVSTDMSRKVPMAVRTLLGTNLPGLGFTVVYAPQPDGVWFPSSFSTEFKIHILFFFKREILIDAQNRDFEKTHVSSKIVDVGEPIAPQ